MKRKVLGFITIEKEIKGLPLSFKKEKELEESFMTSTPIKFNNKKVVVTQFDHDPWLRDDDVVIDSITVSMREYPE